MFDLPMLMWAMQTPEEQVLDSCLHQLKAGSPPDVVLLGSSLMEYPTWFADSGDTLPNEAYYHFRSKTMEKNCVKAKNILNLSVPLLNASDASRIVDSYLSGLAHPRILVYGVGPRDFYDNLLSKPNTSKYFNYLSRGSDFYSNKDAYFANASDAVTSLLTRAFFIFQRREQLLLLGKSTIKEILHINHPASPGSLFPMGPQRNIPEYTLHYKNITETKLELQLTFLNQMLATCARQHIRVILTSMPLTKENRALLPDHLYFNLNQHLAKLAILNGQRFLNANGPEYGTDDFLDSVHLNAKGSRKFLKMIAPLIDAEMVPRRRSD
jgi:hypothetical protein